MVPQVIVTPPDGLLDTVGLVVLEVIVQLLQLELELLVRLVQSDLIGENLFL